MPLRFSAKPSPSWPWALGYYRCSGNGGPQTCLPTACDAAQGAAQHGPSSSARAQDPCGVDNRELPQARPRQAGLQGGGEIKAGVPREVPVTQAIMIEARRASACTVSLFPLWCKGSKRSWEYRGIRQRLPFRCNKTKTRRTARWRSSWSPPQCSNLKGLTEPEIRHS